MKYLASSCILGCLIAPPLTMSIVKRPPSTSQWGGRKGTNHASQRISHRPAHRTEAAGRPASAGVPLKSHQFGQKKEHRTVQPKQLARQSNPKATGRRVGGAAAPTAKKTKDPAPLGGTGCCGVRVRVPRIGEPGMFSEESLLMEPDRKREIFVTGTSPTDSTDDRSIRSFFFFVGGDCRAKFGFTGIATGWLWGIAAFIWVGPMLALRVRPPFLLSLLDLKGFQPFFFLGSASLGRSGCGREEYELLRPRRTAGSPACTRTLKSGFRARASRIR